MLLSFLGSAGKTVERCDELLPSGATQRYLGLVAHLLRPEAATA
jgi:hypothetical protein